MKWQRKGKKVEYCIRLDDACPQMNAEKWARIERILDKYKVRPIVGVIPENRDPDTTSFHIPVKQNGQGKVVQNSMKC